MIRRLGARWNTLHKIVYAIAILGVIHFLMQTKLDISESVMVAGFLFWLLGYRLIHRYAGGVTYIWSIALAFIAPNLLWNANHSFATFSHTAENAGWKPAVRPAGCRRSDWSAGVAPASRRPQPKRSRLGIP